MGKAQAGDGQPPKTTRKRDRGGQPKRRKRQKPTSSTTEDLEQHYQVGQDEKNHNTKDVRSHADWNKLGYVATLKEHRNCTTRVGLPRLDIKGQVSFFVLGLVNPAECNAEPPLTL